MVRPSINFRPPVGTLKYSEIHEKKSHRNQNLPWEQNAVNVVQPSNGTEMIMHLLPIRAGLPHLSHYANNLTFYITLPDVTRGAISDLFRGIVDHAVLKGLTHRETLAILGVLFTTYIIEDWLSFTRCFHAQSIDITATDIRGIRMQTICTICQKRMSINDTVIQF